MDKIDKHFENFRQRMSRNFLVTNIIAGIIGIILGISVVILLGIG